MKLNAKPRPVAKLPAEAQATDNLRDFILSGSVAPGARLTEEALAEQMGIARSTLRTALNRLCSEGIVHKIPYCGWKIPELSAVDVWELWTLRGALEGLAARLLVERADKAVLQRLQTAFAALQLACNKGKLRAICDSDLALHRCMVEATGHTRLLAQYQLVEQQVRLFITACNAFELESGEDILLQHQPIMQAILKGNGTLAEHEARKHNELEGKKLANWLKA
ncbi:hypothetical protein AXE65_07165 [Ventosimonas gracilis]|uniref:HTH gntR-type domain-containing protein n=1 Tax=Ventosimonas gracilis TaxID=1680762 RepID=A0A139SJ59_9GAMM|nr:GntR family transcriptional regulator [Ventosimonas gracilis]KXU34612.1 hypothetical protein AXE65_07165 [Ventosimonas gracilis]